MSAEAEDSAIHWGPNVWVHKDARIGNNCVIEANVVIGPDVELGDYCVVGSGTVIGQPGFGYAWDGRRWAEKEHKHGVLIGDDVHIGANTCVDAGSWRPTVIQSGARIDNLVHVAHNVVIEYDAVVVACAELSGSCVVGRGAWIGPNASVLQRLNVGERALVAAGAVVTKDVPANTTVGGVPARMMNAERGVVPEDM